MEVDRQQVQAERDSDRRFNRGMLLRLLVVVALMFSFGYALVPLYRKICDLTGLNVLTTRDLYGGTTKNTQVDKSRTVTVEFDSTHAGRSPSGR